MEFNSSIHGKKPNKTQESYGRLFALISHLKPKTVISDFEVASTNAAATNNSVEAINNVISSQNANCRNPELIPFIELLKKEQLIFKLILNC